MSSFTKDYKLEERMIVMLPLRYAWSDEDSKKNECTLAML